MLLSVLALPAAAALAAAPPKSVTIRAVGITMQLDYGDHASITSLTVNGQQVIGSADGIFTSVNVGGKTYSSLQLTSVPVLTVTKDTTRGVFHV